MTSSATPSPCRPNPTETWNLYLEREYQALPWPWAGRSWRDLRADDLACLPAATSDFTRYAPEDGTASLCGVPTNLPRAIPVCETRLAVYHDATQLTVFITAIEPTRRIPELAGDRREDFGCFFEMNGLHRGFYFGLNQNGEHIALGKSWDEETRDAEAYRDAPWSQVVREPWKPLDLDYEARVISHPGGSTASWRIARTVLAAGMNDNRIRFTAGRRCYATSELVAWAAGLVWEVRHDELGDLSLVSEVQRPPVPRLCRVDLAYDPASETGIFIAQWHGVWDRERLESVKSRFYADRLPLYTVALNGQEQTGDVAAEVQNAFPVADGWNRLEYLNALGEPARVIFFQKFSGNRVVPGLWRRGCPRPAREELRAQFAAWHEWAEKQYVAPGTWASPQAASDPHRPYCLDHQGVFWMEPYALAALHLDAQERYRDKVRATCERVLRQERPGNWFPCLCVDPEGGTPFAGGAFAHGSVGEALVLGYRVLGDSRYLEAARRAVDAYRGYLWEDNPNYSAFALWHLAELYRVTRETAVLSQALYYVPFAASQVDPSGSQRGHNYYTGYGGITLKGLAKLLGVLPAGSPEHTRLTDWVLRFCNQMLARQQATGLFAERNRKYLGYHSLEAAAGLFEAAAALGEEEARALEPALLGAYAAMKQNPQPHGLLIAHWARLLARA